MLVHHFKLIKINVVDHTRNLDIQPSWMTFGHVKNGERWSQAKEKYQGMFEIQKSGSKTS